jgi:hypothetical protein
VLCPLRVQLHRQLEGPSGGQESLSSRIRATNFGHLDGDCYCMNTSPTPDLGGPTSVAAIKTPPPIGITRVGQRIAFRQLPPMDDTDRSTADCIGKPLWWERRPGGGQVA